MTMDAHTKLIALLCLLLVVAGAVTATARTGETHVPDAGAAPLSEAFEQVVPGLTRADDLAGLGLDPIHAASGTLSHTALAARFGAEETAPAVEACIRAEAFCTGYVFRPGPQAEITLLVMNGRVVHKVFAATRDAGTAQRFASL